MPWLRPRAQGKARGQKGCSVCPLAHHSRPGVQHVRDSRGCSWRAGVGLGMQNAQGWAYLVVQVGEGMLFTIDGDSRGRTPDPIDRQRVHSDVGGFHVGVQDSGGEDVLGRMQRVSVGS